MSVLFSRGNEFRTPNSVIQEPPPPPPKRFVLPSPDLPPLPPLPPEAEERHPLMSPLDVSSLQSTAVPMGLVMDSPHDVIGASSSTVNNPSGISEPLYTITSSGQRVSRTGNASTSSNNEAPPSEISV